MDVCVTSKVFVFFFGWGGKWFSVLWKLLRIMRIMLIELPPPPPPRDALAVVVVVVVLLVVGVRFPIVDKSLSDRPHIASLTPLSNTRGAAVVGDVC